MRNQLRGRRGPCLPESQSSETSMICSGAPHDSPHVMQHVGRDCDMVPLKYPRNSACLFLTATVNIIILSHIFIPLTPSRHSRDVSRNETERSLLHPLPCRRGTGTSWPVCLTRHLSPASLWVQRKHLAGLSGQRSSVLSPDTHPQSNSGCSVRT